MSWALHKLVGNCDRCKPVMRLYVRMNNNVWNNYLEFLIWVLSFYQHFTLSLHFRFLTPEAAAPTRTQKTQIPPGTKRRRKHTRLNEWMSADDPHPGCVSHDARIARCFFPTSTTRFWESRTSRLSRWLCFGSSGEPSRRNVRPHELGGRVIRTPGMICEWPLSAALSLL